MSVSDINNNIRIRTTPLGADKYVKINLNQNFDFLEILSLRIGQEEVYKKYCSDYGVIVGRVICNNGVGVPNVRVSVFIPISDEDKEDPKIRAIYPFENVTDKDFNGIRYNLLPETPLVDDICFTEVGTFPEKRRILDCEPWCEIYGKYYKYTTVTNASGDYIIFGVPTGTQTVHMDADLSDIGYLSQKPYDMINQGSSEDSFESYNKFKKSVILSQLPQIKNQDKSINVLPFWGNKEECEIGINRVDFDLQYKIEPTAFFIGSIFGDSEKNSVNKNCRPRKKLGRIDQLITGPGMIKMIRRTPFGGTESFTIDGDQLIDDNGVWVVQLPMNLNHKVTDEFGNLVDSGNPEQGIATSAKYRFMISMNDYGQGFARLRARAKYLVPNYGDYSFDDTTPDFVTSGPMVGRPNFAELKWNGVYTVRQFISRFSNRNESECKDNNFIGIKDVTANSPNVPFPFNRSDRNTNPLYNILCIILTIIGAIVTIVNAIISTINAILFALSTPINLPVIGNINPFGFLRSLTIGCIEIKCDDREYAPGCYQPKQGQTFYTSDPLLFYECLQATLAEELGIFSFYFTNDWINGTLYAFLFKIKFKKKKEPKFCKAHLPNGQSLYIKDQVCITAGRNVPCSQVVPATRQGVVTYVDNILYYGAYIENTMLFATDIYDLGSMKNCDYYGRPKTAVFLPPTTYNLPELEEDPIDPGEPGIDDLLLEFDCLGVKQNSTQCRNIARICELYVDPDYGDPQPIDINSIDDEDDREVRINLECLNAGLCTLSIANNDGGFGSDWNKYRMTYVNGSNTTHTYNYVYPNTVFSESNRNSLQQRNLVNNSFYFYFGLMPGRTAIDVLKSKYFAPCERKEPCPISITADITNNGCVSGNTGSITAIPNNGTPPYRYKWYKGIYQGNSNDTPICTDLSVCTDTITNLYSGDYTVLVYDNVGQICKRTFTVNDPEPFDVILDYSSFICPGSNNGFISVIPKGGVPPYTINWATPPNGADITGGGIYTANTGSFYINNLSPTSICDNSGSTVNTNSTYNYVTNGDFTQGLNSWDVPPGSQIIFNTTNNCAQIQGRGFIRQIFSVIPPSCPSATPCYQLKFTLSPFSSAINPIVQVRLDNILIDTLNAGGTYTYDVQSASVLEFEFGGGATDNNVYSCLDNISFLRKTLVTNNIRQFYNAIITDSAPATCPNVATIVVDITQSCSINISATTANDYCTSIIGQNLGSGSITWGPIPPQGIGPFTYTLESIDGNYPKQTWNISDREKTVSGLLGGTCPGYTYTATCIDSCGFSSSTVVEIVKCDGLKSGHTIFNLLTQKLIEDYFSAAGPSTTTTTTTINPRNNNFLNLYGNRSTGFIPFIGNVFPYQYHYYYLDFVGCAPTYTVRDCTVGDGNYGNYATVTGTYTYGGGTIQSDRNGVFPPTNGTIQLTDFWWLMKPLNGLSPTYFYHWDNSWQQGLEITRTRSITNPNLDDIEILYYVYNYRNVLGTNVVDRSEKRYTGTICRNSDYIFHMIHKDINANTPCNNVTIRSANCNDEGYTATQ